MNDFTKKELGIIYCNLCINPKTKDILIKIQAMIDNYICHEHKSDHITESGLISAIEGDINNPFKCKYCGEYYE